ncbi:hypothetical protein C8J57DRAFT_1729447 [Mycena rebaudengoi]|nr:hypothetical protein C8J57DRAFT_1540971 [Mycena rebaudengoi]KAJ7233559.1 hypothetical protein C8J57DRAFT_1729447 [Mycena rebaudengoi]
METCRCHQCKKLGYIDPTNGLTYPGQLFTTEKFKLHRRQMLLQPSNRLCICPTCRTTSWYTDLATGIQQSGRIFLPEDFRAHEWDLDRDRERNARNRQYAAEMLPGTEDDTSDPLDHSAVTYPLDSDPEGIQSDLSNSSHGDIHRASYNDDICLTLRNHIERLDVWEDILHDLAGTEFIFATGDSLATGANCTLDPNIHSPALSYQTFLSECESDIEKGNKGPMSQHHMLAKTAKKRWRLASEAFESLKLLSINSNTPSCLHLVL